MRRRMPRYPLVYLVAFVLVAFVAAGALWRLSDMRAQRTAETVTIGPTAIGGPFTLVDQDGVRRSDAEFRGKYMLVFFGYTFCPDVCPTTLAVMGAALDKLGQQGDRIVPIFITVDPERDTSPVLKAYISAFGSKFVGFTGTQEEIAAAAKAYRVYYQAHKEQGEHYAVDHSGVVYLMDKTGAFLANYSLDTPADRLADELAKKTVD